MYTVKHPETTGVQSGCSTADLKDQSTQCGSTKKVIKEMRRKATSVAMNICLKITCGTGLHPVMAERQGSDYVELNMHHLRIVNELG